MTARVAPASPRAGPAEPDPLDSPDFDATAYLNRLFPTEASLTGLDGLVQGLHRRIARIDAGVLSSVREQSRELAPAREQAKELAARVASIRAGAEASEALVQSICRDIRKLDAAKRNLTATISSLRRLGMLMGALDSLQAAVEAGNFAEAARLVEAVQALAAHFAAYAHVPRIAELRGRLSALESGAKGRALREFEALGETAPSQATLDRLADCCALVGALGPQVRSELIDAVCRRETVVYTQIFGVTGETARLERTVNRYKWLLKRLETRREVWALFPSDWRVPQLLCLAFCTITKAALGEILDLRSAELPGQVDALVKAVEATNIFESEMVRRFEKERGREDEEEEEGDGEEKNDKEAAAAPGTAGPVGAAASPTKSPSSPTRVPTSVRVAARPRFRGAISSVFAPYLHVYVEAVGRDLRWGLDRMLAAETWEAISDETPVLRSGNELVDAVRAELRDCARRIGRGQVLRDLAGVFGGVYRERRAPGAGPYALGAADWQVALSPRELRGVGVVLSTADWCGEVLGQLARALAQRLDPPELARDVEDALDGGAGAAFRALVAACHAALLSGVETRLEPALAAAARLDWAAEDLGSADESEYVAGARAALLEAGAALGRALPPNHMRFFADKLLASFGARLAENVLRARRYSEAGSQQARLDIEVIKHAFVDMAREGRLDAEVALPAYAAAVGAELGRAQAILKVVGAPTAAVVDTFFELMPDASPAEFQRIVDLKGLRRADLLGVLDTFNRRLGKAHFPSGSGADAAEASHAAVRGAQPPARAELAAAALDPADAASAQARRTITLGQLGLGTSTPGRTAQDMAARFRSNPNVQAARASAAAASDSMRETVGRTLGAMKNLRFMQREG
ncbi:hypothetical protein QBZ16_004519 [Prototheca wickerhamii]|uniref:Vps53 N-terminal domain-containing protein n=1 Tax=Prototheca wickerhamii TaxID=3111 RepID=A0AAD9ML79_PROWI|nr:hypothetical protein QBZ16_004519 [Prototheca wickerhamii]